MGDHTSKLKLFQPHGSASVLSAEGWEEKQAMTEQGADSVSSPEGSGGTEGRNLERSHADAEGAVEPVGTELGRWRWAQSYTESNMDSLRYQGKLRHLITDGEHNRSYYQGYRANYHKLP